MERVPVDEMMEMFAKGVTVVEGDVISADRYNALIDRLKGLEYVRLFKKDQETQIIEDREACWKMDIDAILEEFDDNA